MRTTITQSEQRVLDVIRANPTATPRQIAAAVGWKSVSDVYGTLRWLAHVGELTRVQRGEGPRPRVKYAIRDAAARSGG